MTSTALVKRTRATFRSAEFGFFGVWVYTRMHTPRFSGQPINAGDLVLLRMPSLPMRTSCANVGTVVLVFLRQLSQNRDARSPHKARRHTLRTLALRANKHTRAHNNAERFTANPETPARNSARTPRGRTQLLVSNRRGLLGFSGLAPHSGRSSCPIPPILFRDRRIPSNQPSPTSERLYCKEQNTPDKTQSIVKLRPSVKRLQRVPVEKAVETEGKWQTGCSRQARSVPKRPFQLAILRLAFAPTLLLTRLYAICYSRVLLRSQISKRPEIECF